jgi:hypothetical protein
MAPTPKSDRTYERPVAWLAGRDLLGGIKGILLYTAYGSKLDPRDWMTSKVVNFSDANQGKDEFWFDYLADAGDGTKAMYSIAFLSMSNLWVDSSLNISFERGSNLDPLPRGRFLFFGGDTAYHVADYLTLANRIQRPFTYAFEDLRSYADEVEQLPVFGIPGNHDYYDQVDGFRRQFRKPIRQEPPQPPASPGGAHAQLGLAGYVREQEASYVALRLPFGWWLWGLDTETGPLDNRQEHFFRHAGDEYHEDFPPKKLIIATSSPSTVFGKVADVKEDFKATQAMQSLLGADQPFLPTQKPNGKYDFSKTGDEQIKSGECRLDLSGDVHHYARYWGPQTATTEHVREHSTAPRPGANSYASVVSGLGGAFHHPSNTYANELEENVLYPDERTSRAAVGDQVFDFRSIWSGGYVWLFGGIIALVIYFALSVTQSTRQFVSQFPPLAAVGLMQREPVTPTTARPAAANPCQSVNRMILWRLLAANPSWTPPQPCNPNTPYYFFATSIGSWPKDLIVGQTLIFLSLFLALGSFFLHDRLFGANEADPKLNWVDPKPNRKVFWLVAPTAIAVTLGIFSVEPYRDHVSPYVSSLLVLFTMIVAAAAITLTVWYNDYLFKKGHFEYTKKRDRFWPWVLPVLAVLLLAVSLGSFGRNNLPALLITDILCTLVFLGVLVALIVLPFTVASKELFYTTRPRVLAGIGKFLIGFWHAALQLLIPFALVRKGSWITWAVAAVLVFLPMPLAAKLFRDNRRFLLTALWTIYGGIMLLLPWLTSTSAISIVKQPPLFPDSGWVWGALGLWGLLPCLAAAGVGTVMACLWFGWYLGVCSIFNGHNNEIGGAARIENYKEFIRFRLTAEGLTGYVIAVDDVSIINEQTNGGVGDGRSLRPRLVDVFHLAVKP